MKKITLSILLTAGLACQNVYAFDFLKFFGDLWQDMPVAGGRAPAKASPADKAAEIVVPAKFKEPKTCFEHYPWGPPTYAEKVESMLYICEKGFAVGFDTVKRTPMWVSEVLEVAKIQDKAVTRTDDFKPHPLLPANLQAGLEDYKGSGFDRGHMAAAEDVRFSAEAMAESFYLTNIVPQVGPNMNRGIWADLEIWSRQQAKFRGTLYVVSGPIFRSEAKLNNRVAIPSHFYKVIIDPTIKEAISFIIPNIQIKTDNTTKIDAGNPKYPHTLAKNVYNCADRGKSSCNIFDFSVPMVEVQRLTNLKFVSGMSDNDVVRFKVADEFVNTRVYGR